MRNLAEIKLKTLLLTFSLWHKKQDPYFNDLFFPPLGIPVLAGYLKSRGYVNLKMKMINFKDFGDIKTSLERRLRSFNSILDFGFSHKVAKSSKLYKATELLLNHHQPDLIGFSISFYKQLFFVLQMAKIIKSLRPKLFIVFGGPIVTANIERMAGRKELADSVDGLIVGDGEEALAELIYNLDRQQYLKNVPNLYYKDENGNFKKSDRCFEAGYNHLILPDFSDLNIKRVSLRVSVGCPWGKCSFCTYRLLQKKYKIIGARKIVEIMEEAVKKYGKRIIFYDDSFLPLHLKSLSEAILKKRNKVAVEWDVFFLELHSGFLDESIPRLMKKAGCRSVTFGLESISPRILNLMSKRQRDPRAIIEILRLFKRVGINVDLFIIFGFPSETKEEAMATFNFLKNNRDLYNRALIQRFCLEEGTEIFNNPSKFSISFIDKRDRYLGTRFGFRYETTKGMTTKEVNEFMKRVKKYFPYPD